MKKITLLFLVQTVFSFAQDFKTPYEKGNGNQTTTYEEMVKFYGSKMNFAFINLDDTQDQFVKTSKAMFTGIQGNNYYATGGMKSEIAKKFAVYGFKMPSFFLCNHFSNGFLIFSLDFLPRF